MRITWIGKKTYTVSLREGEEFVITFRAIANFTLWEIMTAIQEM
jgi:hypothetical protein